MLTISFTARLRALTLHRSWSSEVFLPGYLCTLVLTQNLALLQNLYTTRLDASNSKISRGEAERIAAEIMAGDTTNRHRAEERGHAIDDSGVRMTNLLHVGSCRQL